MLAGPVPPRHPAHFTVYGESHSSSFYCPFHYSHERQWGWASTVEVGGPGVSVSALPGARGSSASRHRVRGDGWVLAPLKNFLTATYSHGRQPQGSRGGSVTVQGPGAPG